MAMRQRSLFFGTGGFKSVWCGKGEGFKEKCRVPTVKHRGGSVLMWGCVSALYLESLKIIVVTQNTTSSFCFRVYSFASTNLS